MTNTFSPFRSWPAYLTLAAIALTAVFTALDPGPSQGLGTAGRALFWFAHTAGGLAILGACQSLLGRFGPAGTAPPLVQVLAAGALGAVFFAPYALVLDLLFPDAASADTGEFPALLTENAGAADVIGTAAAALADEFSAFILPLSLTWLLVNVPTLIEIRQLRSGVPRDRDAQSPPEDGYPAESDEAGFWERVPLTIGRDLVALSAELHYLRVYTLLGDALVLYSFGRAVEELESAHGMQIHRSHWVALDHVVALERDGEKLICKVEGDRDLPVSRPYRPALRAALR